MCRKGKGKEAKLGYAGHLLMENRNGLAVPACVTPATGTAERDAALDFAGEISGAGRVTLGGDKNYDTHDFVKETMTSALPSDVRRWLRLAVTARLILGCAPGSGFALAFAYAGLS